MTTSFPIRIPDRFSFRLNKMLQKRRRAEIEFEILIKYQRFPRRVLREQ